MFNEVINQVISRVISKFHVFYLQPEESPPAAHLKALPHWLHFIEPEVFRLLTTKH